MLKLLNEKEVNEIINNLRFEENKWFFTSRKIAKKFAMIPLILTEHLWGCADNNVIYHITSLILKRAFQLERVTREDMNFGTDKQILDKLDACDDPKIKRYIGKAKFIRKAYKILSDQDGSPDFVTKTKFRGIDPWVYNKHTKKFKRLSEIDKGFAKEFNRVKNWCNNGMKIQLKID